MQGSTKLKRKSFFVSERSLTRARRALQAKSDSEAVRLSLDRVAEMEEFWSFMDKTRGTLKPGSFRTP
jgi:hypothetical protein